MPQFSMIECSDAMSDTRCMNTPRSIRIKVNRLRPYLPNFNGWNLERLHSPPSCSSCRLIRVKIKSTRCYVLPDEKSHNHSLPVRMAGVRLSMMRAILQVWGSAEDLTLAGLVFLAGLQFCLNCARAPREHGVERFSVSIIALPKQKGTWPVAL